jgi:hypothetical protein
MIARLAGLTIVGIILVGCADTQTLQLDNRVRRPTTSVDIYKGNPPNKRFQVIAELSWKGPPQDELRAQRRFMSEAQKLGGNGIITSVDRLPPRVESDWTSTKTIVDWLFKAQVITYESAN